MLVGRGGSERALMAGISLSLFLSYSFYLFWKYCQHGRRSYMTGSAAATAASKMKKKK